MFSSVCNIREKRRDVLQITIYMLGKFRVLFCYGKYLLTCLRVLNNFLFKIFLFSFISYEIVNRVE